MLLGGDLFAMLEAGGGFLENTRSLETVMGLLHLDSLVTVPAFMASVLGLPASLSLGGVGLLLAFAFRNRD